MLLIRSMGNLLCFSLLFGAFASFTQPEVSELEDAQYIAAQDDIDAAFFDRGYEYPERSYYRRPGSAYIIKFAQAPSRVRIAKNIARMIEDYQITSAVVPEKTLVEGAKHQLVVESYIEHIKKDENDGLKLYKKLQVNMAAEIAFLIIKNDIGDLRPYQNLPLQISQDGSLKACFIDCGCDLRSGDFSASAEDEYYAFLEKLSQDVRSKFKNYSEIGVAEKPADLLLAE